MTAIAVGPQEFTIRVIREIMWISDGSRVVGSKTRIQQFINGRWQDVEEKRVDVFLDENIGGG